MALNDITPVFGVRVIDADTWVMDVLSGAGAGRWVVRDGNIDLPEYSGDELWLAQGDEARFREWFAALPAQPVLRQYGVDQYGRLVGDLRSDGDVENWSRTCRDEGRGSYLEEEPTGGIWVTSFQPRRPGAGFADQLIVDTTQP